MRVGGDFSGEETATPASILSGLMAAIEADHGPTIFTNRAF